MLVRTTGTDLPSIVVCQPFIHASEVTNSEDRVAMMLQVPLPPSFMAPDVTNPELPGVSSAANEPPDDSGIVPLSTYVDPRQVGTEGGERNPGVGERSDPRRTDKIRLGQTW